MVGKQADRQPGPENHCQKKDDLRSALPPDLSNISLDDYLRADFSLFPGRHRSRERRYETKKMGGRKSGTNRKTCRFLSARNWPVFKFIQIHPSYGILVPRSHFNNIVTLFLTKKTWSEFDYRAELRIFFSLTLLSENKGTKVAFAKREMRSR